MIDQEIKNDLPAWRSGDIKQIAAALAKFQGAQGAISKRGVNPFLGNNYATLDDMIEGTRKNLSANGLSVIQLLEGGAVRTILLHDSGEYFESFYKIEATNSKGLNDAQTQGVAITYARRYSFGAILGLSTEEDTDGADKSNREGKSARTPAKKLGNGSGKKAPAKKAPVTKQDLEALQAERDKALADQAKDPKVLSEQEAAIAEWQDKIYEQIDRRALEAFCRTELPGELLEDKQIKQAINNQWNKLEKSGK